MQALETLGKLEQVAGNVRMTLDKSVGSRADLIITEKDWKKSTFTELVEALRQWVKRNPLHLGDKDSGQHPKFKQRDNQFATRDHSKERQCIYCENDDHRAVECTKVVDVGERKKILSVNPTECKSKTQCYKQCANLTNPT